MIDPLTGIGLIEALNGLNAEMQGLSLADAYNQHITGQYPTNDGPTIGFADYTSDRPAISGDTSGTISAGTGATPVDAWNDYVENTPGATVSDTTGGAVSGSKVGTFVYSIMEENPGTATAVAKAVIPVAVPIEAAITAIGQAAGVSIDAANLDAETKNTLVNSYVAVSGVIYDKAKGLVTAWKDELGRILFPKKAFDSIYDALQELGIGPGEYVFPEFSMSGSVKVTGIDIVPYIINGLNYIGPGEVEIQTNGAPPGNVSISNKYGIVTANSFSATYYAYYLEENSQIQLGNTAMSIGYATITFIGPSGALPQRVVVTYNNTPTNTNFRIFQGKNDNGYTSIISGIGVGSAGEYPDGTSQSQADSYNPSTIPIAGNIATSYDPDTGVLGTEPVVPIHITDNPYNATGSIVDPTSSTDDENAGVIYPGIPGYVPDVDDPSAQPKEESVPIPIPIPDTKPSNPDVPIVNPSVIDSTRIDELVEELANTLDPQPPQSSGIIPVPQLPGIVDTETGDRVFPSIIPDSGPGFIHVYNPTPEEFVAFGTWLWVTYADATIEKILNNPFDGVIGAHELYATPNRGDRDNIRSAFLTCPTTADLVPNRYSEIDCGTVIVPEFYGNYLDYSPYSQAYIYLPFIGINEVSIDDVVGHAVNIRYRVDSYSGSCIAMIFVAKDGYQNLCYQFAGSCSVEVPMAGGSQAAIKAGMMQAEAYARAQVASAALSAASQIGTGIASGNVAGIVMGALGGLGTAAAGMYGANQSVEAARVANKSSVQHSGQFGASHGAMGQKIPFIIIRNPIQVKVVNYNDDYGFPAHKRVIIGGCTGYLRVREVNVISAHATDDEKAAIEALLKNGVYVS